jgi:hypothetical protein
MQTILGAVGIPTIRQHTNGSNIASASELRQSLLTSIPTNNNANIGLAIYSGHASTCDIAGIKQPIASNTASTIATVKIDLVLFNVLIYLLIIFLIIVQKYIFFSFLQNKLSKTSLFSQIYSTDK